MRAVVTGSRGFIGRHLVCALLQRGWRVHEIDVKINRDVLDCPLPAADRVFHLAAQTDAYCEDAEHDAEVNVLGTVRMMRQYRERAVLASSSMVNYQSSPYAISKAAAESYALHYGAAVARLCNVFGMGGHSVWEAFERADVLEIRGDGEQLRTYAHVSEAVELLLNAQPGRVSKLSGTNYTVNRIADTFNKPRRYVPALRGDVSVGIQQ